MLVDIVSAWALLVKGWILWLYQFIFPEYPLMGIAVFVTAAVFLVYYLVRRHPDTAFKMAGSTIVMLSFMLYVIHWLIKLYRVIL